VNNHRPWIIAHRGARDEAPENTRSALLRALDYPIEGLEFDVQLSLDGVPVLHHDHTLYKVSGRRRRVADLLSADLAKIDWGGWFKPAFAGEPLAPLATVLPIIRHCPNMCIEIKSDPIERSAGRVWRLAEKVLTLIHESEIAPFKNRILILSFDPHVLIRAHEAAPDLRYVLNLPEKNPRDTLRQTGHLWAMGIRISNLSTPLAQWVRGQGLRIFTYTCNGPRQVKKAVRLGADAIITDRPGWLAGRLANQSMEKNPK